MIQKLILFLFSLLSLPAIADETSVAGLFPTPDQGRQVWNFNPGWRFHLGDVADAEAVGFDDSAWEVVSTPHSVKLEPAEASGGRNYQGIAWYRKRFKVPADRCELYFEAVMGKQKVYVNGRLAGEHFGGYLPIVVDLGKLGVKHGEECVVAVMADNSDDKTYPPGKPQYALDFCYHGGIYRDVWLIAKNDVFITDPSVENRRDAGIFVHYGEISEQRAEVFVEVNVRNGSARPRRLMVENALVDAAGKTVGRASQALILSSGTQSVSQRMVVKRPRLWSPETPCLYKVVTSVKEGRLTLDGGTTRIGIRSIEFRGREGFWLNGKRYRQLVGANRHQDFAYVGNAVPAMCSG